MPVQMVGVSLTAIFRQGVPDIRAMKDNAQRLERLGFDAIWSGDHIIMHSPMMDVMAVLATYAAVTERIKIGTAVKLTPTICTGRQDSPSGHAQPGDGHIPVVKTLYGNYHTIRYGSKTRSVSSLLPRFSLKTSAATMKLRRSTHLTAWTFEVPYVSTLLYSHSACDCIG